MPRPSTAAVRLLTGEREPVRLATTGPIDVDTGGLLTIDGVVTEVGDRVLVKDQTDGSENGIRTASEGQWYRAADARTSRTMQKGTTVTVQEGAINAEKTFRFDTLDPVIGDDPLVIIDTLADLVGNLNATAKSSIVDADRVFGSDSAASLGLIYTTWAQIKTFLFASTVLTGTPTAPTAAPGTNTTQLATTGFVKAAVDVVLGGVSSAFDTLSEIATDLGLKMVKTANLSDLSDKPAARGNIAVPTYVATRAALKALDTTKDIRANFDGSIWEWTAGNFATLVTGDPVEGVYAKANAIATTAGAWVRRYDDALQVEWFGTVGDGSTDDWLALQCAINLTSILSTAGNLRHAKLRSRAGARWKINSPLVINQPIDAEFLSQIEYNATSGDAVTVGSIAPVTYGNEGYDLHFASIIQVNGQNVATPGSVNAAGATGLRINSMAHSTVRADVIKGFTKYGFHCDGTGGVYAPQVVQHNHFDLGQLIYNGNGIFMDSLNAATSSCQVCRWDIKNVYSSFSNIVINNTASDSHTFNIDASDNCNAGGYIIQCAGKWNTFDVGYTAGTIRMEAGTAGTNRVYVANTLATGVAFSDASTPVNWLTCGAGVDQAGQIRTLLGLDGAWTAYTPTVGSGSGTITTSSATGRYKQIGTKTYAVEMEVTITTNGTGATTVTVTLPFAAKSATAFAGRATNVSGKALSAAVAATGSTLAITNYDNTYPGANGEHLVVSGIYELN